MSSKALQPGGARPGPEPQRVLVTHADRPVGRQIVEALLEDAAVLSIVALGTGPAPGAFDRPRSGPGARLRYQRVDLASHRSVTEVFDGATTGEDAIDAVVYVPGHGAQEPEESEPGTPRDDASTRAVEAHLVQRACLRTPRVRTLIALGSAFVYRLVPGNANRLNEESELDFDASAPPELRAWVDCDMTFRGDVLHDRLRVVLLRLPTVVTAAGEIFFHPTLSSIGRESWLGSFRPDVRPMGYDPICALISDEDVSRVTRLALHARHAGVYNVAGPEALPLSVLSGWTGRWELPVPGPLLSAAFQTSRLTGGGWLRIAADARQLRHGFTLDTSKAERELGFRAVRPTGLARSSRGELPIQAVPL